MTHRAPAPGARPGPGRRAGSAPSSCSSAEPRPRALGVVAVLAIPVIGGLAGGRGPGGPFSRSGSSARAGAGHPPSARPGARGSTLPPAPGGAGRPGTRRGRRRPPRVATRSGHGERRDHSAAEGDHQHREHEPLPVRIRARAVNAAASGSNPPRPARYRGGGRSHPGRRGLRDRRPPQGRRVSRGRRFGRPCVESVVVASRRRPRPRRAARPGRRYYRVPVVGLVPASLSSRGLSSRSLLSSWSVRVAVGCLSSTWSTSSATSTPVRRPVPAQAPPGRSSTRPDSAATVGLATSWRCRATAGTRISNHITTRPAKSSSSARLLSPWRSPVATLSPRTESHPGGTLVTRIARRAATRRKGRHQCLPGQETQVGLPVGDPPFGWSLPSPVTPEAPNGEPRHLRRGQGRTPSGPRSRIPGLKRVRRDPPRPAAR